VKPDNILLEKDGYIRVVDFGLARMNFEDKKRSTTLCGTVNYMAREMVRGEYGKATDWWSVGIIFYEMLIGELPFDVYIDDRKAIFDKILTGKIKLPSGLDKTATSLLQALLCRNEKTRIGSNGIQEIKNHAFFRGFDWTKLLAQELTPPFIPTVQGPLDVSNFNPELTRGRVKFSFQQSISNDEEMLFKDFDSVNAAAL